MQTITIATFNESEPAERLREWLQMLGIPAKVRDQRLLQSLWFLAKPYGAFHLDVRKDYYAEANDLLSEWHTNLGVLAEALRCPECGSLRLEYPHMTRKFMLPTFLAHVLTLFGVVKHHFYCCDCQHTWRLPRKAGWQPINLLR